MIFDDRIRTDSSPRKNSETVMLPKNQDKFKRVFSAKFRLNSASNSIGLL